MSGASGPGRGERRVFVERVDLGLDFDPRDYDTVTVAVLWAGEVRRAVERLIRGGTNRSVRVFHDELTWLRAALEELVATSRLSWCFGELPCGSGWVLPLDFLAACRTPRRRAIVVDLLAGDPRLSRRLYERLMPHERQLVVLALEGRTEWGRWDEPTAHRSGSGGRTRRHDGAGRRRSDRPVANISRPASRSGIWPQPTRTSRPEGMDLPAARSAGGGPDFARWHAALGEASARMKHGMPPVELPSEPSSNGRRPHPDPAAIARSATDSLRAPVRPDRPAGRSPIRDGESAWPDGAPAWATVAGGIVFAFPWLGAYLEAASVGSDDPVGARRRALADLVAPALEAIVDDALVRILAGDHPAAPRRRAPPSCDDADEAAAAVLRAFAEVLPGFERSTQDFLRAEFLLRPGRLLQPGGQAVVVRLGSSRADLVLDRLPYPVSPFRLPWTPEIHVEVSRDAR